MLQFPILTPDFNSSILLFYASHQQAWIADKSQLKVAEKSRRRLTWAEAADITAMLQAMYRLLPWL